MVRTMVVVNSTERRQINCQLAVIHISSILRGDRIPRMHILRVTSSNSSNSRSFTSIVSSSIIEIEINASAVELFYGNSKEIPSYFAFITLLYRASCCSLLSYIAQPASTCITLFMNVALRMRLPEDQNRVASICQSQSQSLRSY